MSPLQGNQVLRWPITDVFSIIVSFYALSNTITTRNYTSRAGTKLLSSDVARVGDNS